jgi:hypothetical protein
MIHRGLQIGRLLVALPILAMPLVIAFETQVPTQPAVQESMEATGGPAMIIAVMVSDLDEQGAGVAEIEDRQRVMVYASPDVYPQLRGSEVLVYHSSLWNQWRLVSTDIGVLSPGLRPGLGQLATQSPVR